MATEDGGQEVDADQKNMELTKDEAKLYKETFEMFDPEETGSIKLEDIGTALRVINQNPSEAEIKSIIDAVLEAGDKNAEFPTISFDEFCVILKENSKPGPEWEDKIVEAFQVFDKPQAGLIDATDLKQILLSMGEALSEQEADELLKEAEVGPDGKIAYENFARVMQRL